MLPLRLLQLSPTPTSAKCAKASAHPDSILHLPYTPVDSSAADCKAQITDPPWAPHLALRNTLKAYKTWEAKTQDIITKTTDELYAKTLTCYRTDPLLTIPSPTTVPLLDICAQLNRALPLLRSKLYSASRQRLRRQASDRTRQMTEQAASHKIKQAIRYTLGAKIPHYDFSSIRSDTNEIFCDPIDVHNMTTNHFHAHFKAQDASTNFHVDFSNMETLVDSRSLFMAHPNHNGIAPDIKELLWNALTCTQGKLSAPTQSTTLREQLRTICGATPSFDQFAKTLQAKSNDSSPGPTGLSYRLLKLLDPPFLEIIYSQLATCWSTKHIPD